MKYIKGLVKQYNKDADTVDVIASTGTKDREGETLNQDGWKLDRFKENPVLLWSHEAHKLPIGKVINIGVVEGQLRATAKFAEKESSFASEVAKLVRGGFINTTSVGFLPTKSNEKGETTEQELLELSFVNVPANPDARVSLAYKSFQKKLNDMDTKSPACRKEGETVKECQERKIPELIDEGRKQDEAVAIAISMCKKPCEVKEKPSKKEGRIISEKNRNEIRIMIDACKNAASAGEKLLDVTKPPEKLPDKKGIEKPRIKAKPTERQRLLRIIDKSAEALLAKEKGGEL